VNGKPKKEIKDNISNIIYSIGTDGYKINFHYMFRFSGITVLSWKQDNCAVVETPTNLPYIDTLHSQLGVALGGNGYAAKSSDEIGRIAADMMLKGWNSGISRDELKLLTMKGGKPTITKSML